MDKSTRRKFIKNVTLGLIGTAGVFTFLKSCTRTFTNKNFDDFAKDLVDGAFRLTDHTSLLNLEFYFINCKYSPGQKKLTAKYGPHENYMIVRLPQQHISEQSFALDDNGPIKAATYISGYSYLVFRILFPVDPLITFEHQKSSRLRTLNDGTYTDIYLTKEDLLDWNNERRFRLVVRQDLTESLFQLTNLAYFSSAEAKQAAELADSVSIAKDTAAVRALQLRIDSLKAPFLQNHYPFQKAVISDVHATLNKADSLRIKDSLKLFLIPKVYGDPVTAIEIPWRLIISPRIPDSGKFRFIWNFPETNLSKVRKEDLGKYQLWNATLFIGERSDEEYLKRKAIELKKNDQADKATSGNLEDLINQLELMILGSPDHPKQQFSPANRNGNISLPSGTNRTDLVALYIKLKILARTEKLTFSALGASAKIHLKNQRIEDALKKGINVLEWDQIISLGRDEKVEVSTLFLEAEFGHKMAYIQVAERQLKNGKLPLIRRELIMPLDIEKDYTNHITQHNDQKNNGNENIVSRFNAPFKKISFLDKKPKELVNKPFDQKVLNHTKTSFEFEAIDWHENVVRFVKEINAIPFNYALSSIVVAGQPDNTLTTALKADDFGNTGIYTPGQLSSIPDSSSLLFKDTKVIKSDTANQNEVKINALDSLLKNIKDSSDLFVHNLDQVYLNGISQQDLSRVDEYLSNIKEYYDSFFQYLKNLYEDLYSKGNQTIESIQAKISFETLKAFLIEHYFFRDEANFKKLEAVYQDVLLNIKIIKEKGLFIEQYVVRNLTDAAINQFSDHLQKVLSLEAIKKVWKENTEFVKLEFEKWLMIRDLLDFSASAIRSMVDKLQKKENLSETEIIAFLLLQRINTDFPEISRVVTNLQNFFEKDPAKINELINNIKNRLSLFYELEKMAKEIPGLVLLQKQKIGYAIKERLEESSRQLKKSLSQLESEYIIFEGGLRQTEKQVFDFFHEYAIIPQMRQAKVYVSALNKLVNEDLPINIKYARDYLENQAKDTEFEIKQNAAMVFGEVKQASREQIKGLIQKLGDKMPGINMEVPAHFLTYAKNPNTEAIEQSLKNISKDIGDQFTNEFGPVLKNYSRDLVFISEDVKKAVQVIDDLRNVDPKKYFKDLGAKLFGSIALEDILDLGFDLPRITELPDRLIYQASTDKFKNFTASFVIFRPNAKSDNPTRLDLFVSKSLKDAREYYAYTQLNNFSVGVVIGGTEVLTVTFEQFKIVSAPNHPKKTDVSITDVKLGGPLEFIADLAKKFMAPGNGMRVMPGPRNLTVDYTIALPDIKAPAFNFRNLQLVIGVNIPYDPSTLKAISFSFGVNKPEDKFLVSAGIYGGRGHFQLRATPKGIEQIDVAIELGAYASLDLGIGKGEVFLFFGFWFITGKDENNMNLIKAVAYVICAGSATVLGFITIGVSVLIALTYIKRGEASLFYGEAVVTYSVKIAFFKKEFSIRYYKEIAGSSKGNGSANVQTAAILLDVSAPGVSGVNNDGNEAKNFTDVFKDVEAYADYLACFA